VHRVLPLVLLAAACATARASHQDADALACGRGDSASCARRGLRALTSEGVPRDERDAAAWLMAACERGYGQSCADLGALYAAGRGVRQDDGRACELGLADACARAGRPVPPVARAPGVVLPPPPSPESPPARDRGGIERALQYADLYVPARDHEGLGLTRAALEADPPAPEEDIELIRPLLQARGAHLASCLPARYRFDGGITVDATATLSFVVARDGRATGIVVKELVRGAGSPSPADCMRAAVTRWEFPRPYAGGRTWFEVQGNGPEESSQASRASQGASGPPRYRAPREKVPGCTASAIRLPRGEALTRRVKVKYFVDGDGRTTDFHLAAKSEDGGAVALARAVRQAVYSCAYLPGADESGTPVGLWVIQEIVVRR
jgi:hypothetical protein